MSNEDIPAIKKAIKNSKFSLKLSFSEISFFDPNEKCAKFVGIDLFALKLCHLLGIRTSQELYKLDLNSQETQHLFSIKIPNFEVIVQVCIGSQIIFDKVISSPAKAHA